MRTVLIPVRWHWVALLTVSLLAGCTAGDSGDDDLLVVATTSIWGDVAAQVIGDHGRVETLIPRNVDTHDFQPSPQAIAVLRDADLVVANGLGLEEGMTDILAEAVADGVEVMELAPLLDPIPLAQAEGDRAALDPHVWFDPLRIAEAVELLAGRLRAIHPSVDWTASSVAYVDRLRSAHQEVSEHLSTVPVERRELVSNHDSLGYLAARYGFEVLGVVIPGGSTLADPSSAHLAALISVIEEEEVGAIFSEAAHPARLAEAVAAEAGDVVVVELHVESLGEEGSGAETLIDMLIGNASKVSEALGDQR